MSKKIDLIGQKFSNLIVVKEYGKGVSGGYKWVCICECGNTTIVSSDNLRRNHTQSCGCLQSKRIKEVCLKHGQTGKYKITPEYRAWTHMKTRCYNKKCDMYNAYGGRGITVCERWLNNFEIFFEDMGKRPSKNHSLDRIDVNGNYEPNNCRWANVEQQVRNKTNNNWIEFEGNKMIINDWAKVLNTTDKVIRNRIKRGVAINFNSKSNKVIPYELN